MQVAIERVGEARGKKAPVHYSIVVAEKYGFAFTDYSGQLEFLPLSSPTLELALQQGEAIPSAVRAHVLAREHLIAQEEQERTRLTALTKIHSFKEIAELEGISVREVKRRIEGRRG